uniref:cell division protein n=1 Tax=Massjukichlorella minus TaxID=2650457 RepID=UPI0024114329|nr:cell division protein [Massjukichlorella minus]WDY12997.1 cell division protein [Massjukichlorella minus]
MPGSTDTETFSTLLNSFSYSPEIVRDWIKFILPRPTPLTLIFSATLYLAAICSTIQRQQGDRWLGILLQAKMPGCTKVFQETSWETFENLTSQSTLVANSLNLSTGFARSDWGSNFEKSSRPGQAGIENLSSDVSINASPLNLFESNSLNKYSNQNLQMVRPVTINSSYNNLLKSESVVSNTLISDIDMYKDQALIRLRSPWNKQLRKEFLGFFPEQLNTDSLSKSKQIGLRWYKIDACNDSTRIILPIQEWSEESSKENTLAKFETCQPPVGVATEKQLNYLEALNPLFLSFNSQYGKTWQSPLRFRNNRMPEKIVGFQYLLPFHKKAIYLESDSIPSKLDSPYLNLVGTPNISKSLIVSNLLPSIATPQNRANDNELRVQFEKSTQNAYGIDFSSFQTVLKELFYSYGLNVPDNFNNEADQNVSELNKKNQDVLLKTQIDQNLSDSTKSDENQFVDEEDEAINTNESENEKNNESDLAPTEKKNKKKKKTESNSFSKGKSTQLSSNINSSNRSARVDHSSNPSAFASNSSNRSTRVDHSSNPSAFASNSSNRSTRVDHSSNQWFTILSPLREINQYDPLESESLDKNLNSLHTISSKEILESLQLQPKQLNRVTSSEKTKLASSKVNPSKQSTDLSHLPAQNIWISEEFIESTMDFNLKSNGDSIDDLNNQASKNLNSSNRLTWPGQIGVDHSLTQETITDESVLSGLQKPIDPEDQKEYDKFVVMFETSGIDSGQALQSLPRVDKKSSNDSKGPHSFRSTSVDNSPGVENSSNLSPGVENSSNLSPGVENSSNPSEETFFNKSLSVGNEKNNKDLKSIERYKSQSKQNTNHFDSNQNELFKNKIYLKSKKDEINTFKNDQKTQNINEKLEKISVEDLLQNDQYLDNLIEELCKNSKDCTNFQKVFTADFSESNVLFPRLMSGYKFPELRREEISSLFKQFIIPRLLMCPSISFPREGLINSILLSPLHINLPPVLPLSLIKDLAFPFLNSTPVSVLEPIRGNKWMSDSETSFAWDPLSSDTSLNSAGEVFNVDIQYRPIRLEELSEVREMFKKFGRDYDDYLSRPTDSPPAITISPSLEDDKLIEEEHNRIMKERELARLQKGEDESEDEYPATRFEQLQEIRENEANFEKSKDFQPLAYDNKLAYHSERVDNDFSIRKEINSWISSKVGHKNMLSDRKYSFLGRMHFLSKKLVAELQKDINENIVSNGQRMYSTNSIEPFSFTDRKQRPNGSLPLRALIGKARKDLIDLLEAPDFEIHNSLGVHNRKYRPDLRLRLKRRNVQYSHLNWHKRKSRSTLLGLPTNRHVIMPEITVNQWKNIIESELQKYFLHEGKRLHSLVRKDPEKTYKIQKINVYLPWVTVRTPIEKPFEWPLTRLDCTESPIPTQFDQVQFLSSVTDGSEKLRLAKFLQNQSRMDYASDHLSEIVNPITFSFPQYHPVDYWGYRRYDTLSSPENGEITQTHLLDESNRNLEAGIRQRIVNKQLLFEPITNQSYLFIYRFFLALALKEVCKYIYRVTFKKFIIGIANSELGLTIMSPEFRSALHHAPPKSFYKSSKLLRDVAGAEDGNTIPVLSDIIWSLRNRGRGCATPRGVLVVGPSGTEKTSLIQAIAGEAEVPIIVQSMRALTLTYNKPYEQLEKIFKLARKEAPCLLFFDELDAIGKSRFNVVNSDIGSNDSLLSLDPEMGSTKLRFAHLSAVLQTDLLQKNSPLSTEPNRDENVSSSPESPIENKGLQGNRSGTDTQGNNSTFTTYLQNQESEGIRINLLLQLLTEMDGIKALNGVVIIATSEQPSLLDPALLRPGRFDKRINLQLPNHEKRIQLFKTETQKIGAANSMPWDYFGIRTANMSGIDILSAINHSAIRAILDDTVHTVETLEHGLNCVIGLPNKKISSASLQQSDPFHTSRLAFYQAGRGVVQSLLMEHPNVGFLSLTEPVATSVQSVLMSNSHFSQSNSEKVTHRSSHPTPILSLPQQPHSFPFKNNGPLFKEKSAQQSSPESLDSLETDKKYRSLSTRTRIDLETRLVGLYAGKAGELLHVSAKNILYAKDTKNQGILTDHSIQLDLTQRKTIGWLWQSNLGFSELLAASSLIHLMIDRWYLYSSKIFTLKSNQVRGSLNNEQIRNQQFLQIFQQVSKQLNSEKPKSRFWGNTYDQNQRSNLVSGMGGKKFMPVLQSIKQDYKKAAWWEAKVCQQLQISERSYGKWYRIYLPKLEQNARNEEWLSPDTLFHQKLTIFNVSRKRSSTFPSLKSLNDLYQFERDLQYHNTVINCFYRAFNLLNDNRELLDLLADHLIRFKILRSYEIEKICSLYIQSRTYN